MPLFHYEAQDQAGKKVIGTMQVTDESVLSRRLQAMGYVPVMVQQTGRTRAAPAHGGPRTRAAPAGPGVPTRVLSQFYYELYMSLQAGLPAFQALFDVAAHTAHPSMRSVVSSMAEAAMDPAG